MPVEDDQSVKEVLGLEPVAVVGCSRTPGKDAHEVPSYLRNHGFDIVPVNPNATEIFGRNAHPSLSDVDQEVRLVNVFRPSDEVDGIVDEALARDDVRALWLQLGIDDAAAVRRAEEGGLIVVRNRCMRVEHQHLANTA